MISKNRSKFLKSLQIKKYRKIHRAFLVEGEKSVKELLLSDFVIQSLYCTEGFYEKNKKAIQDTSKDLQIVAADDLAKTGSFESNTACLAVVAMQPHHLLTPDENEYMLVLEDIQDPGNLGTIIRIADWYGVHKIICSEETVDLYNPKVIAASMASFLRVRLYYCDLEKYLLEYAKKNSYGAVLQGENIHQTQFKKSGFLVLGNESKGLSEKIVSLVNTRITIPSFGKAESLNVAVATAIICDNLRRIL